MVERVAFATCGSKPCICKNRAGFGGMDACLSRARAAISAMREPTDAMVTAGWPHTWNTDEFYQGDAKKCWQAMTGEALK